MTDTRKARERARKNLRMVRGGLVEDLDRAAARLSFLAEVSRALSCALSDEECYRKVVRIIVPYLADWCTMGLVDDSGRITRVATAHINPAKARTLSRIERRMPPSADAPVGLPYSVRTHRAELVAQANPDLPRLERYSPDPEFRRIIRGIGVRSYITVPLVANREMLGAIWLARSDSGQCYTQEDLRLAQQVAERAASAVYHQVHYQKTKRAMDRCLIEKAMQEVQIRHMRHDLLSILTSVRLAGQMIARSSKNGDLQHAFALRVVDSVDRAVKIAESSRRFVRVLNPCGGSRRSG